MNSKFLVSVCVYQILVNTTDYLAFLIGFSWGRLLYFCRLHASRQKIFATEKFEWHEPPYNYDHLVLISD